MYIVQEAWWENVGWGTFLDDHFVQVWMKLKEECLLAIPRRIDTDDGNGEYQLHIFCDGSAKAYGAIAYRVAQCDLILSKERVAPLKNRTLPQLELTTVEVRPLLAKKLMETLDTFKEVSFGPTMKFVCTGL